MKAKKSLTKVTDDTDNDSSNPPLLLSKRIREKIAAVRWRAFITTTIIFLGYFLLNASISLIGVFYPAEAIGKGVTLTVIGVIIAVTPLAITISSPIIGFLLPKIRIPFSVLAGFLLVGAVYVAMGLTIYLPSGWPFIVFCLALRMIEGIGTALFLTSGYTMVTSFYPDSTGSVIGTLELSGGLGYAFGPVMGGYLYKAGGYKLPFFTVGAMYYVLALPILLVLIGFSPLALITSPAGYGIVITSFSLFIQSQFALSPEKVGLIFLSNMISYIVFCPLSGVMADKINPRVILISGLVISGVGYQMIGPTPILPIEPQLWLSIIATAIATCGGAQIIAAVFPSIFKTILLYSPELVSSESERIKIMGAIAGMINGGMSLGQFIGPVFGGGITELTNFRTCTAVFGEMQLALMTVLLVVTIIDHYLGPEESKEDVKSESELVEK